MEASLINNSIPSDEWHHETNCLDSFGFSSIMTRYRSNFRAAAVQINHNFETECSGAVIRLSPNGIAKVNSSLEDI